MTRLLPLLLGFFWLQGTATTAFAPKAQHLLQRSACTTTTILTAAAVDTSIAQQIAGCEAILERAAETKQEDSDAVQQALADLEKAARAAAKQDKTAASTLLQNLNGDWRLVFTTGTAKTQERFGKVNYFPLKAIQSFSTLQEPMGIENGIYVGDWVALKFSGTMEFDLIKRRLEFDFDTVALFDGAWKVPLKAGEAAGLGAKSGLGSESNVKNAAKGNKAFFNWISANDKIATARGGGGGLALWKRV